jgi:hypothetical protein
MGLLPLLLRSQTIFTDIIQIGGWVPSCRGLCIAKAPGEIKEVTLKKFKQFKKRGVSRWEEERWGPGEPMTFTHFTFEKLLGFLKLLTELDLANLNERRIALREHGGGGIDAETQAKMRSLLKQPDGLAMVDELLRNGSITSRDLVNIGYRKSQLEVYKGLLCDPERLSKIHPTPFCSNSS